MQTTLPGDLRVREVYRGIERIGGGFAGISTPSRMTVVMELGRYVLLEHVNVQRIMVGRAETFSEPKARVGKGF